MRGRGRRTRALRLLAAMPFLDRLELAAMARWSDRSAYEVVARLGRRGLVESVPHATVLVSATKRFSLTAAGVRQVARERGMGVETLLRTRPVSAASRRILLRRLDAVAVVYRLARTLAADGILRRFQWYRALPLDTGLTLADGRTVAVVRQGNTSERTAFANRLWRLWENSTLGALLVLVPDPMRLRQARRLVAGAPVLTAIALERDAASAGMDSPVWRLPSLNAAIDLRTVLSSAGQGGALPVEPPPVTASLPPDLASGAAQRAAPGHMLPSLLGPTEKRTLDLLSDWPWITPEDLRGMLDVSPARLSQILGRIEDLGLVSRLAVADRRRLVLTGRGIAFLAYRDRASVGAALKRWTAASPGGAAPASWRDVPGTRSRQLLRNIEHTDAVHGFLAAMARQARSLGWEVVQLDPPRRAVRFFRHGDRLHSVRPDAFGILRKGRTVWPFLLEWERRAVHPSTMRARLAPYLRYFSSRTPLDDHGAMPTVLIVFDNDLVEAQFFRVAREQMSRTGVRIPLRVSHLATLNHLGPSEVASRHAAASLPTDALV